MAELKQSKAVFCYTEVFIHSHKIRLESNLNFRPGSAADGGADRQHQHQVGLLGERALSRVGWDSTGIKESPVLSEC